MLKEPRLEQSAELPKERYGEPLLTRHGTVRNVTGVKYGEKTVEKQSPDD